MEKSQDILAVNVRLARQRKQVSQEDLAGMTGIDRTYVSGIERGLRNPSLKILYKLAEVLETAPATLITKDAFYQPDGK
jgi:transcriptional regulator with XRE-family HTH domain